MSQEDKPVAAQEPFCYMSDQFEVGLFTEPPTDPFFADMFPVYRNQIDAQAKITEQAAELSRETTARKWAVESLEQYKAECTRLHHEVDRLAGENDLYRAEMSAAHEAGFETAQDLYTSYLGQADRIKALEAEVGRGHCSASG